ncbi:MAG: response regulator, partial [[Eubacterium] sulci]|nr:response regulator [[Eubacterium] sulci]
MVNILVCDDDKEIAGALEIYLRNEGYNVFKAYDGMEALNIVKQNQIHLILMDVMMPNLDGIQATM